MAIDLEQIKNNYADFEDFKIEHLAKNEAGGLEPDVIPILIDEIRKPLTDFEESEKKRTDELKEKIADIEQMAECDDFESGEINSLIEKLEAVEVTDEIWQEFFPQVEVLKKTILKQMRASFIIAQNKEQEDLRELNRLADEALRQISGSDSQDISGASESEGHGAQSPARHGRVRGQPGCHTGSLDEPRDDIRRHAHRDTRRRNARR